ncbi:ABC transporter substrate-binding protein [Pseudomaricurvus alcaniphilus]|uniref:ABC transporter substrate-binding protein n=1 Tax=Pseudomaricurvus alcaniphilus TaxID=1166482 RepID=UPI00140E6ACA|nr:ABC transporter substrate-binding protein [Pseudomaricurvus alcaniphilus]NHN40008.1 ABC transporter substrate-binding protein [Pseudomaricurvus alcaniphilus]
MIKVSWFVAPALARVAAAGYGGRGAFEVEATLTPSSDAQFDALLNGSVDAVVTAMDYVMAWNDRPGNLDACIIGQVESTTPLTLVGISELSGLKDLVGRRLLVDAPGNGFVVALQNALLDAGVDLEECIWVEGGGVAERLTGLREGVADATLLGPPFDAIALGQGFAALSNLNQLYPVFPGQGLVVRRAVLEQKKNEVSAWLVALEQARRWMLSNSNEARAFLENDGVPAVVVNTLLQTVPNTLVPDRAGIELLIEQRQRLYPAGVDRFTYQMLVDKCALVSAN